LSRFRQQNRLFPDKKSPVSGEKVAVTGNNRGMWTGHYRQHTKT